MMVEVKPLAEITQEAVKILYEKLGVVNTIRFINQFTVGYGNYLDEVIAEIKQSRREPGTTGRGGLTEK